MTSAARRASPASSIVQQPREPARQRRAGCCDSARCTPVTSCPASAARAAATAESTPPDMAASTFTGSAPPAAPARRPGRSRPSPASTSAGVEVWPRENRSDPRAVASSAPIASSTWLGWATPGRARRAGGALDAVGVEQHQQRVALAAGEGQVGVAGQPRRAAVDDAGARVAVQHGVRHAREDLADEVVAQPADHGGPLRRLRHRQLDGGGEADDRGGVERAGTHVALLAGRRAAAA